MSSLFKTPGDQASQAAQGTAEAEQKILGSTGQPSQGSGLEGYVATAQQNQRDAIGRTGANPYFEAASKMNPTAYAVDPNNTASFGAPAGPGVAPATPTNAFAPQRPTQAVATAPPPAMNANGAPVTPGYANAFNPGGQLPTPGPPRTPVPIQPGQMRAAQ